MEGKQQFVNVIVCVPVIQYNTLCLDIIVFSHWITNFSKCMRQKSKMYI